MYRQHRAVRSEVNRFVLHVDDLTNVGLVVVFGVESNGEVIEVNLPEQHQEFFLAHLFGEVDFVSHFEERAGVFRDEEAHPLRHATVDVLPRGFVGEIVSEDHWMPSNPPPWPVMR